MILLLPVVDVALFVVRAYFDYDPFKSRELGETFSWLLGSESKGILWPLFECLRTVAVLTFLCYYI